MTESNKSEIDEQSPVSGPGAMLKEKRIEQGLSVKQVADKLYLKQVDITALEEDRLDSARSLTFIKGYVKNYAKLVELDVDEVVVQFEQFHKASDDSTKLQSFSKRVAKQATDDRWMMVTYLLLIVIIGGVVWWWLQQPKASVSVTTPASPAPSLQITKNEAPKDKDDNQVQEIVLNNPKTLVAQPSSSVDDISAINNDIVPSEDNVDVSAEDGNTEETNIDSSSLLADGTITTALETQEPQTVSAVFTFSQDCWVNIVDGTGEAIAYGVKASGRIMKIEGVPPFDVTLGAPQAVSIVYNGNDVDMSDFTGDQIARLVLPRQD